MPSNGRFTFTVRVGDKAAPEYSHNGETLIESNLFVQPYSFHQEVSELVYGEVETQEWPVTPYSVEIHLHQQSLTLEPSWGDHSWMQLIIDGVMVDKCIIKHDSKHTFKGFPDKQGIKEFLFALPRFARDSDDRVSANRVDDIGIIKVQQYKAIFCGQYSSARRQTDVDFEQANKKDAFGVTGGAYTLSTTKQGRVIAPPRDSSSRFCSHYTKGELVSELSVRYMMGHSLMDKGIHLVPPSQWSVY